MYPPIGIIEAPATHRQRTGNAPATHQQTPILLGVCVFLILCQSEFVGADLSTDRRVDWLVDPLFNIDAMEFHMSEPYTPTEKRSIAPVTVTVEITATRINQNGTLSGITAKIVKMPKGTEFKTSAPPTAGGGIYIQALSNEGLEYVTGDAKKTASVKVKLF